MKEDRGKGQQRLLSHRVKDQRLLRNHGKSYQNTDETSEFQIQVQELLGLITSGQLNNNPKIKNNIKKQKIVKDTLKISGESGSFKIQLS